MPLPGVPAHPEVLGFPGSPRVQLPGGVWWGLGCHSFLCSPREGRIVSHLLLGVLPGPMVPPLAMGVLGVCPGGWRSLPVLEKWR